MSTSPRPYLNGQVGGTRCTGAVPIFNLSGYIFVQSGFDRYVPDGPELIVFDTLHIA